MKKVTSILAVAVMAVGIASMSFDNTSSEIDNAVENSQTITCGDCDVPLGDRIPPKKIA